MNIGILGCGHIAVKMALTIKRMEGRGEGVALHAFASRTLEKAERYAKDYGAAKAYGSYEALAADPQVDLVYIATPHSEHYRLAKMCLERGRNVLVEKPFTTSAKQAKELLNITQKMNLFLSEAIWTRYLPSARVLARLLEEKPFGEYTSLSANLCYAISEKPRHALPSLAGGALLDLGVYPLHFALMAFGERILSLHACASFSKLGVDDATSCALLYEGGRIANLFCSQVASSDRQAYLYAERGYVEFDNVNHPKRIRLYELQRIDGERVGVLKQEIALPEDDGGFEFEIREARDAIGEGRSEPKSYSHEEMLFAMERLDEIRQKIGLVYPFDE